MNLAAGDEIVAALRVEGTMLLVVHEHGLGKAVNIADYPLKGRGTGGVQSSSADLPRREPAGRVAGAACLSATDQAIILTAGGALGRVPAASMETVSRAAVTRRLLDLAAGDEVSGVWVVRTP